MGPSPKKYKQYCCVIPKYEGLGKTRNNHSTTTFFTTFINLGQKAEENKSLEPFLFVLACEKIEC